MPTDQTAVDALRGVPPNWNLESDEELARFLLEHMEQDNENLGSVKQFVESVDVSSCGVSTVRRRVMTHGRSVRVPFLHEAHVAQFV